jgi:hypothetical protein
VWFDGWELGFRIHGIEFAVCVFSIREILSQLPPPQRLAFRVLAIRVSCFAFHRSG